jgi:short-subunit dehydrogenase
VVTGASSGIGAALAKQLAARGLEVWLCARRKELLDALVGEIEGQGGKAHALVLDVSHADQVTAAMTRLDAESGGIDLVVANAGVGGANGAKPLSKSSWQEVRDFLQINLVGAAATLYPFIGPMLARGHGHLVGVSSVAADVPTPRSAPYGASKAGLTFFLEAADMELRARGIDVTIIHPGFIKTPMTADIHEPMPFLMDVDKAAKIIDRAIQSRRRLVRLPWQMALVTGVGRRLPRWLARPIIRRAARER